MSSLAEGSDIVIATDGLVRVDGIAVFKVVVREDKTFIEFFDHDRMRSKCRGTKFVEVEIGAILEAIAKDSKENNAYANK